MTAAARFLIELPPRPEFASAARLFAGGVARQFGCGEDDAEDAKLAISEAVALAAQSGDGAALVVSLDSSDGVVVVDVEHASFGTPSADGDGASLAFAVLRGLFPDVEPGPGRLRFRLPLGG